MEGDLSTPAALHNLVAGSAGVVHAAGAVRGGNPGDFEAVNAAGTAALLATLRNLPGTPRLLLMSSLAAREPGLSWYARSKRSAEQLLEQEAGLDWVILRPPPVYGPGDREMLPIFRWMARGLAPVPGDVGARISLVHVDDLVTATLACLQADSVSHRTLTLCDGRVGGYDWRDLAGIVGKVCGRRVRLCRLPGPLLDAVAATNLWLARLTRRKPMLTPAKLRELRHPDWVVDNAEITAATGWEPQIGLQDGLRQLLAPGA